MADAPLLVSADVIGRILNVPVPLSPEDTWIAEEAVRAATSDVQAYLGRPIVPVEITETGLLPTWNWGEWDPLPPGWTAWRLRDAPDIEVTILDVTPETTPGGDPTGYYTVHYRSGLDAINDPLLEPIRRFVRLHAVNSPDVLRMWQRLAPRQATAVRSLSVEGQSVTIENVSLGGGTWASRTGSFGDAGTPGSGGPGSPPTLKSLSRWKLAGRRVRQGPTRYQDRDWERYTRWTSW